MNDEGYFGKVVTLLDEENKEVRFEHILTFMHEGERYVALTEENSAEEAEVIILKIEEREGEDVYVSVDDEGQLEAAFDTFIEMMDELEQEDENPG